MPGLSLAGTSRGCSPAAVRGLLTAVASLDAEHGLQGVWAHWLQHVSSDVVGRGISGSIAHDVLVPGPGIEPVSPALTGGFLTTGPPEKSPQSFLN